MLGLVRSLTDERDALLSVLKSEGATLDLRLLKQRRNDNDSIKRFKRGLDDSLVHLQASLEMELLSLRQAAVISPVSYSTPETLEQKTEGARVSCVKPTSSAGIADYWKNKQEVAQSELKSLSHQLDALKRKLRDTEMIAGGNGNERTPENLMCALGALRGRLQSARAGTHKYKTLLGEVEDELAAASSRRSASGDRQESKLEPDYEQEALSLCSVEASVLNELEAVGACVELAQKRKADLESKIGHFRHAVDSGKFDLPLVTLCGEWPHFTGPTDPVSEKMCFLAIDREQDLDVKISTLARESRVQMLRELNEEGIGRWIEQQRIALICERTEAARDAAEEEKNAILQNLDEICTDAKVHFGFVNRSGSCV